MADMAEETPATPTDQTNPAGAPEAGASGGVEPTLAQESIDALLEQASFDDPASISADAAPHAQAVAVAPDTQAFNLPSLNQAVQDAQVGSIDLLRDVDLNVKIELGRARMLVEDVLRLSEGSVVELDKLAGDPVDVFVNDRLVARGEVLVLNDNFCVRINEIIAGVKEEGL
jgi:flagellar motor switch protein FliN